MDGAGTCNVYHEIVKAYSEARANAVGGLIDPISFSGGLSALFDECIHPPKMTCGLRENSLMMAAELRENGRPADVDYIGRRLNRLFVEEMLPEMEL